MAKITAPVKGFTGESFGVAFSDGVGETEDRWLIQRFKEFGYTVVGDKKPKKPAKEPDKEPPKREDDSGESEDTKTAGTGKAKTAKSKS